MEEFRKLGLSTKTVAALKKKGFEKPTHIQSMAIPILLEGKKDIVGQSQTGTGKTASFALPIIEKLEKNSRHVQAIILTPTRELAIQVAEEIESLKGEHEARVLAVYGGSPIDTQRRKLKSGVDIVVGTPGRVMDLQKRKSLILDDITYAVLDEADEMLNMGFVEDIENILKHTPKDKSMLLFSATMPKPIMKIAKTYMREYEFIEVEHKDTITTTVEQTYYDINAADRVEGIRRVIDFYPDFYGIVFCNTKATVDALAKKLNHFNFKAAALHGDITQSQRERILNEFRNKNIKVLVATDVAARGIDVNDLTHVINHSIPQTPEVYVHRIGRTGRAGKKGIAITFLIPSERRKLGILERENSCKLIKKTLPSIDDIMANKEGEIKGTIERTLKKHSGKEIKYTPMIKELLANYSAEEVISAALRQAFKSQTDYKKLSDVSAKSGSGTDRGGYARRGRSEGGRSFGGRGRDSGRGRSDRGGSRSGGRPGGRSSFGGRSREGGRSNSDGPRRGSSEGRAPRTGGRGRPSSESGRGRSSSEGGRPSGERKPRSRTADGKKKWYS